MKYLEGKIIKQSKIKKIKPIKDLDRLLFKKKIIDYYLKDSGLFVILPEGQQLYENLKRLIEKKIKYDLRYKQLTLPKISPLSTFKKANIIGKWDDYLEKMTPFSNTNGVKEDYILDPLQCTILYQYLEGKRINKLLKFYDASGPSYRNEDLTEIKPLIKQREFHRAEFIYIGTKEEVIKTREKTLEKLEELCNELNLQYRIVIGSGCYQISEDEIETPKNEREIPIKDLEIYIPQGFLKKNKKAHYLEVAGAAALGEIQTKRFNIKKNGKELWSGCTGIGLERLMYSFLSQHGFDKKKW